MHVGQLFVYSIQALLRDRKASVMAMFAGLAMLIVGLGGGTYDFHSAFRAKAALQDAADAAVLSAANAEGDMAVRSAIATRAFQANTENLRTLDSASSRLSKVEDAYRVDATGTFRTTFAQVLGIQTLEVNVFAEATAAADGAPLEFVIGFDITNSTFFSDAQRPQAVAAVQAFIDRVFEGAERGTVVGTVMPFSDRVRLPTRAHAWATGAPPSNWRHCFKPRYQRADGTAYPTVASRKEWQQIGTQPPRLTDDPPRALRFEFQGNGEGYTYYQSGGYFGQRVFTVDCHGNQPVVAEENPAPLKSAVADMGRGGSGRYDEAMAWAWRILSPRWRNEWNTGRYPRDPKDTRKLIVLVTDGRNGFDGFELLNSAGQSTPWGWNTGTREGFESLERVCADVKQSGIEIAVLQMNGNDHATSYLRRCATEELHFTIHNLASFTAAFETLASYESALRLSR